MMQSIAKPDESDNASYAQSVVNAQNKTVSRQKWILWGAIISLTIVALMMLLAPIGTAWAYKFFLAIPASLTALVLYFRLKEHLIRLIDIRRSQGQSNKLLRIGFAIVCTALVVVLAGERITSAIMQGGGDRIAMLPVVAMLIVMNAMALFGSGDASQTQTKAQISDVRTDQEATKWWMTAFALTMIAAATYLVVLQPVSLLQYAL